MRRARRAAASIVALLAGVVLTFCLIELGLRLAGLVAGRRPPAGAGGWTVLCLGDSFTYTGGGDSYPDQLARRLAASGVRARVINRGVNGINSNQLADMIDGELERWRPDAAIVLVGADNFWTNLPIRGEPLVRRVDRALLSTRTWKLLKLLWIGIAEGSLRARYRADRAPRDRHEAIETVRLALERQLDQPDDWYRVQLGDPPEAPRVEAAVEALAARVAAEPEDVEARVVLGQWRFEQGDARGAEQTFREGLAAADCRPLPMFYAGLAKALERTQGEAAARFALGDAASGGRCRAERRLAEAEWRLWRGEPAAAAAILRAVARERPGDADIWRRLGDALYDLKDYDGSIAAFREHARRMAPEQDLGREVLSHALLRKWEARRAKDPGAPPPQANADDIAYSWFAAGDYDRCAASAESRLRSEPLAPSLFYTYALCLQRAGRFDEAMRLAVEVPALRDNLMYRYYAAQRARREALRRPLEELEAEQFGLDMERIALAARRRGVPLVLANYPEEEYEPVRRTAQAWGLPYADFLRLFRARFKDRDEFLGPDRCHPNARGFAVMAEEFHRLLSALPGFPAQSTAPGKTAPMP